MTGGFVMVLSGATFFLKSFSGAESFRHSMTDPPGILIMRDEKGFVADYQTKIKGEIMFDFGSELEERKPYRKRNRSRRRFTRGAQGAGCQSCGSAIAVRYRTGLRVCIDCLDDTAMPAAS